MLGEELGDDGTAVRWIVDPIDGTRNYVRGVPVWATLLALEREGRVDVGRRLGAGARTPLVGGARRGRLGRPGYERAPERLQVSAVARVEDAVISTDHRERNAARLARPRASGRGRPRGFGDFWQHCLVAEGSVDLATDPVLSLWDYAAVQLIVEEAGGRCTTFAGDPPAPGASYLSANAALHAEAVAALAP